MASGGRQINYLSLVCTLLGISLVVACGCVLNNIIDRDIDRLMERTKNRVLALGLMSVRTALIYALLLGTLGLFILYKGTNELTTFIAGFGLLIYVGIYSLWLKRHSIYATIVGSIAGAVPPLAAYCAVANRLDTGACILFLMLCIWQIPHSYAIAIYRFDDYARAKIPTLAIIKGLAYTKVQMLIYVVAFVIATLMLYFLHYTGSIYFISAGVLGAIWIRLSILGFRAQDTKQWARKMFIFSIICITLLSVIMSIDTIH